MIYAVAAGHLIPQNQIKDALLICLNRTQAYKQAYLAYRQLPVRNYTILQQHFELANCNRIEVEDEAAAHGYGGNALKLVDREIQRGLTGVTAALTNIDSQQVPTANTTTAAPLERLTQQMAAMQQTLNTQQS